MCDICVCRFDHHCIWVNNCIGIGNHRLFLGFLLSNCMLTAYGATLGGLILAHIVISTNLHKATFIHQITKEKYEPTFMTILHFLVGNENILVFVTVLCAVMSIVLLVFFFWHLNLLRIGQTSNELSKWRTLKEYLKHHPDAEEKKFIADLHNTYHKGFWGNLREVILALDLHAFEEEVDVIAEKDEDTCTTRMLYQEPAIRLVGQCIGGSKQPSTWVRRFEAFSLEMPRKIRN